MTDPRSPAREVADANERVFNIGAASVVGTADNDTNFAVKKYPENLGDAEYPHYVMFFIHVRQSDISSLENPPAVSNVQFDLSQNNSLPKTGEFANAARTVVGGVAGAAVGSRIGQGVFDFGIGRNTGGSAVAAGDRRAATTVAAARAGAGVVGFGIGAVAGVEGGAVLANKDDRTQVLLKDAIALYISGTPSTTYSAQWDTEDLGMLGGASQQIMSGLTGSSSGMDKLKSILGGLTGGAAQSFMMKTARDINPLGLGNVGAFGEAAAGQVANPFKAQLFKNMEFRQFAFEYTFAPRNETEYKVVQEIIQTFKRYMHPTLGKEKFVMDYPAEFTLGFYHRDQLNKHLFKVSNCALTNMKVEYGGTDLTTFRDIPGAPSEISIKLTFVELELLSRERVDVGY